MLHDWSGERLETFVLNETTIEHLHRYALAIKYTKGKTVLDVACGEGYGSALLANTAERVIGIDIDEPTVKKAAIKYVKSNLEFKQGDARQIPLPDASVDAVVSFETLEHISEHDQMLAEIKRVLKADGLLIMSTPDKKFHYDGREAKSRFHEKELYEDEFKVLLQRYFAHSFFLKQNSFFTSAIFSEDGDGRPDVFYEGDFTALQETAPDPVFIIGIASGQKLAADTGNSFFKGSQIFYDAVKEYETAVFNSLPYKTGAFLLAPLKWLRDLLKPKK